YDILLGNAWPILPFGLDMVRAPCPCPRKLTYTPREQRPLLVETEVKPKAEPVADEQPIVPAPPLAAEQPITEAAMADDDEHRPFAEHRDFEVIKKAFARIQNHRKLFRRDWLPFIEGVYGLSVQAWEDAGKPTKLDGKPDWGNHHVLEAFRALTAGHAWV